MEEKLNRLYFTANLRERDLGCLITSLNRLRRVEILAEKQGIKSESEIEDCERIITLLVPTAQLTAIASGLEALCLEPRTLDVYDPAALPIAVKLGFTVEDMTSEN